VIPAYGPGFATQPGITRLLAEVPWIRVTETRAECFMAHGPVSYTYGQGRGVRTYTAVPFAAGVRECMAEVNAYLAMFPWGPMTGCFLNRYDHQHDHLGWHADDFRGMDHSRPVVVVSFGEPREIWWRLNGVQGEVPPERRQRLGDGSIFVMPPGFQQAYQHRIPKGDRAMGPRVSLTFRAFFEQE
jgi:alkylated DNA repair dioxygenase AlkB